MYDNMSNKKKETWVKPHKRKKNGKTEHVKGHTRKIGDGKDVDNSSNSRDWSRDWQCFMAMDESNEKEMKVLDEFGYMFEDEFEKGLDIDAGKDVKYVGMTGRVMSIVSNEANKMED